MAHFYDEIMKNQEQINVVFFPELNEWNGDETMNLVLKDMKLGNQ